MRDLARASTQTEALWRAAQALARRHAARHGGARGLPPLLFFTDPARTPDPVAVAERLPAGAGVVYRHFGAAGAERVGQELRETARRRRLILLVGDDEPLAAWLGADGLHLPERRLQDGPRLRARHPLWLLTGAAHSARALALAGKSGLDAAVLSPVFPSRSPSAASPRGALRTAELVRTARLPVLALGGVSLETAARLSLTGVAGFAAVEGLSRSAEEHERRHDRVSPVCRRSRRPPCATKAS